MYRLRQAAVAVDSVSGRTHRVVQSLQKRSLKTSRILCEEVKGTPYKDLSIGAVKETFANEKRVALSPGNLYCRFVTAP